MADDDARDPIVTILTPRGRGRPRSEDPHGNLTVWVPHRLHDRLIQIANRNGESVSTLVRAHLVRTFLKP